ncbi:phytanoyl-CoA dioxygenase family protein [Telmatospirillum siberiense]|nr:phytanoyl-CoA dioxygenase family protein [Telmatospirillum siberiense]
MAAFGAAGWLLAPAFFDGTAMAEISDWIDDLSARPEVPGAHWVYHQPSLLDPEQKLVQRIENFCPHHQGFETLARHSLLSRAVSQLLKGPSVLFKEKINFKEPGGAGFELHQDQQAGWSRYAPLFVTAMVCVDPATIKNGCLEVACGLGRLDRLIADEWRPISEEEAGGFSTRPFPTNPGDVIFFDSFVPHASQANTTQSPRRMLFFTYNGLTHGDQRDAYHVAKRASFPPDVERAAGAEYKFRV